MLNDFRFALRMLFKTPGLSTVVVLTLALGIGGTTAMFSVLYGVVLNPFPYPDSHRMAVLVSHDTTQGGLADWTRVSASEFLDYQEQNHVFDELIGAAGEVVRLTGGEVPAQLYGKHVTGNTFQVLGVQPLSGRPITPEDCRTGASPVVVLGHKVWRERFGSDPGIVGQTLILNHRPVTVVGIMPPRFRWEGGDIWLPAILSHGQDTDRKLRFSVIGRLKAGVSISQVSADTAVVAKRLATVYPEDHPKGVVFEVEALIDSSVKGFGTNYYILMAAGALILLIACTNVANILLARATEREKEFAVRAALGASRVRLVCQVMMESFLLALFGGTVGCMMAWNGIGALVAIIPARWGERGELAIGINGPVLLFTLATALLSTLLSGSTPALLAAGRDLQEPLKAGGRGSGETSRRHLLRNLLVVSEVALSLVLLSGAGLLMPQYLALLEARLGYNLDRTLSVQVGLPESDYNTPERKIQFQLDFLRSMRATPGVAVATLNSPPVPWEGLETTVQIAGKPVAEDQRVRFSSVGDRFFELVDIHLLQGRGVSEQDLYQRRKVAVINWAFARRYFAGENPIGRQVRIVALETNGAETPYSVLQLWFEIVGVSADMVVTSHDIVGPVTATEPAIYIPFTVHVQPYAQVVLKTTGKPSGIENSLRRASAALDKELPLNILSLKDQQDWWWFDFPRFVTTMLVLFASLGLVLVSVGVYSVLSYAVSRRTQEIGIRMALGAEATDVRRMVMISGLRWLLVGIGIGVPVSIALAKILQNRIWGIKSADPLTLVAVSLLLTVVGLAACYFPARRATKVDPMVALRYE